MLKIILIIPTLKQGGAERVMSELANEWAKTGDNDVHLILLTAGDLFYSLNDRVVVHRLGFENRNLLDKVKSEFQIFFRLRKLLKSLNPDFILSFMIKYNIFTLLASTFLNSRVFVSDRSNPQKKVPFLLSLLQKVTYKYATGIIAQTTLAKNVLEKSTKNKNVRVIPNPLRNVKLYPHLQRRKAIINVGRLIDAKGQAYLLQSFSKLSDKSWELIILGEGPLREELTNMTKELSIEGRVSMPGSKTNVDEWLAISSIFAFPSISEGFPNALVEAMAAGLPCVSFDCDAGPRDIIQNNKNGYLVNLKDTDLFKDKLEMLIKNDELRDGIGKEALSIRDSLEVEKIAMDYLTFCLGKKLK